ncbi:TetR family transcriptional regulator [Komagataeibacter diospyri]|uniref:TetR family transcriptional regulator n=1 Tax=Komagataeibacter diospyri TaxID=1932662 RepID=A0A4P5NXJ0_9PROT|nr:TetR family transcriptional regulator [Komagataeibacter diospyri]GCE85054.1 TetR family transcriptional regulator [Komagataeibacter diospyri]GCE91356.1 TetR family transcriptional regulator [Komagataeibacter diospyri]
MTDRRNPRISVRKQPGQARSAALVATILEAAVRVLAEEGATRFTTARVAEKAGVSIGSLYQYFPNKAAILFRLQTDEWRETTAMLRNTLDNAGKPPLARLRALTHAFIRSECAEASVRVALDDAAPLYRDAPEAAEVRQAGNEIIERFMREVLPNTTNDERTLAGDLIRTTFGAVGKAFSETPRSDVEIAAYADAMADMFEAYLLRLSGNI